MTLRYWIPLLFMAGALAFAGCAKTDEPVIENSTAQSIDASTFRPAFSSATPEIKAIVDTVMMSIQASIYKDAVAGLDKLAGLPELNEEQKKVVADLKEQVQAKMAAQSP